MDSKVLEALIVFLVFLYIMLQYVGMNLFRAYDVIVKRCDLRIEAQNLYF